MEPEALRRWLRRAALMVVGLGAAAALAWPAWGRDFIFAGLWSVVNLCAWQGLVESGLVQRKKSRALAWGVLKLPILFGVGFFYVVNVQDPSISALLSGFHVIFVVLLIQFLWKRARPETAGAQRGE